MRTLNQNGPNEFYAIGFRVLALGPSRVGVRFEMVDGPAGPRESDDWRTARASVERQRAAFWSIARRLYPKLDKTPVDDERYVDISLPPTAFKARLRVAESHFGIGVRRDGATQAETGTLLGPCLAPLTAALGLDERQPIDSDLVVTHKIDMTEETNWLAAAKWLHLEAERYRAAFAHVAASYPRLAQD